MIDRGKRFADLCFDARQPLEVKRPDDDIARHRQTFDGGAAGFQRRLLLPEPGIDMTEITLRVGRLRRIRKQLL